MSASPTNTPDDEREVVHQDNTEAAKWRRKLRDTEAQRDLLAERLAGIQREQIDGLLVREHVTFDALTAAGATLADLCDSGGRVDTQRVQAAAQTARELLGIDIHAGLHVPAEGKLPPPPAATGFSSAFAPRESR